MATAPSKPKAPGRENAFTRKIGPLPMWAWLAIVGGAILLWAWYEHRNSASGTGATSGTASDTQPPEVIQTTPPEINIYGGGHGRKPDGQHRHGARKVAVPDVIGQQYETGARDLSKAGLTPQRSSPFVGKVTRESPSAGSHVARGTTVTLSGRPWPQTQFRKPPKPGEKKAHKGGKVNPGGAEKKPAAHKKRRHPKVTM